MTDKKIVMVIYCPNKPEVLPHYFKVKEKEKRNDKEIINHYCCIRDAYKGDVKIRRVVCNIDGCFDAAEKILEEDIPGVAADFQEKNSIRVGGRSVTCLCEKHYDRLNKTLADRIFTLEERVDELEKIIEHMHDLFEYREDLN